MKSIVGSEKEMNPDPWHWGKQMIACLDDLRIELQKHQPPVVDWEIMPSFTGSADDIFVWFICDTTADVEGLKATEDSLKAKIQDCMKAHKFPASAVSSLQVGSTSLEDIEKGGGRFYFFR